MENIIEYIFKRAKQKALKQKFKSKFDLESYENRQKEELIKSDKIRIQFD